MCAMSNQYRIAKLHTGVAVAVSGANRFKLITSRETKSFVPKNFQGIEETFNAVTPQTPARLKVRDMKYANAK